MGVVYLHKAPKPFIASIAIRATPQRPPQRATGRQLKATGAVERTVINLPPPTPNPSEPDATTASAAGAQHEAPAPEAAAAEGGEGTEKKRRNTFNSIEIADQVQQVQEWLVTGHRPNQIRSMCAERWGLSSRVSEGRIAMARKQMIMDVNIMDRKEKAAQIIEQLENVLKMSLETKQCSNAIGSLSLQAKLLGLLARDN